MSRMILAGLSIRSQLVDKPFKLIFAHSFNLLSSWPIIRIPFKHHISSFRGWQGKGYLRMAACEQLDQCGKERARAGKTSPFAEQRHKVAFTF